MLEIQNMKLPGKISKVQKIEWKHCCFDEEAFKHTWLNSRPHETRNDALKLHQTLKNRLACDTAMPIRSFTPARTPAYWWNDNIAECRCKCLCVRRKTQRARNCPWFQKLQEKYMDHRRSLKRLFVKARCSRHKITQ